MDRINVLLENSKRAVRYWWLLAVVGIALLAAGILIFAYPSRSYLAMATLFGWLMFLSGMLEAALSAMNRHFVTGRGWMAVGGLIEIILGLILIFNVSLSEITLRSYWVLAADARLRDHRAGRRHERAGDPGGRMDCLHRHPPAALCGMDPAPTACVRPDGRAGMGLDLAALRRHGSLLAGLPAALLPPERRGTGALTSAPCRKAENMRSGGR